MAALDKILFIGHEASRTGAPLLMLELIKWLTANSNIRACVLLKRGGEIESDYRAIAPTTCYTDERHKLNRGLHRSVLRKLQLSSLHEPNLPKIFPPQQYPVVYANTADTCDLALRLVGNGRRFIHHIHELSHISGCLGATETLQRAVPITDCYIADSCAVRDFLVTKIDVPTSKIHVIHPFRLADCHDATRDALRRQLSITDDVFVIGMCGLPQWRKGTDLFIQLALFVRKLGLANCHFVWLGGDSVTHREALHDVAQLGLQDVCHFLPTVLNPQTYLAGFDLFALTSREDPFSVAMLEAAAAGLPIVCFADAGGAPEFVDSDAGVVVPYLDIAAMANACIELLMNNKRREKLGGTARMKVQLRNSVTTQGPKFLALLRAAAEGRHLAKVDAVAG